MSGSRGHVNREEEAEDGEEEEDEMGFIDPSTILEVWDLEDGEIVARHRYRDGREIEVDSDEGTEDKDLSTGGGGDSSGEEEEEDVEELENQSLATLLGHQDGVLTVAFHPVNEDVVATGSMDEKGLLWKVSENLCSALESLDSPDAGRPQFDLLGHKDTVVCTRFSADGTLLATASLDGSVRIWNTEDGSLVQVVEGQGGEFEWVDWHPRGPVICTGCEDGTLWMHNARSGDFMQVFTGHSGPVHCGAFTMDGKNIISASEDGSVRLWDPRSGEVVGMVAGVSEAGICSLARDPRNLHTVMVGTLDGEVSICNLDTGKAVSTLRGHSAEVECVGYCNTESLRHFVASGSQDSKLVIWDLNTKKTRHVCEHPAGVVHLVWHPEEPWVLTACLDRVVRLWDARRGTVLRQWTGPHDVITELTMSKSGKFFAVSSEDYRAMVFALEVSPSAAEEARSSSMP